MNEEKKVEEIESQTPFSDALRAEYPNAKGITVDVRDGYHSRRIAKYVISMANMVKGSRFIPQSRYNNPLLNENL